MHLLKDLYFHFTAMSLQLACTHHRLVEGGLMSSTMWMAVFLFDMSLLSQVPYYLINNQYQRQISVLIQVKTASEAYVPSRQPFQLSQHNPCMLSIPS